MPASSLHARNVRGSIPTRGRGTSQKTTILQQPFHPFYLWLRSAAWGTLAWLVYGIVELILSAGIQLWRFPETQILGWQWRLIAMLVGTYAVIGTAVGILGGIVAMQAPEIFASLTIPVAFTISLISAWPLARSEYPGLVVALLLVAAVTQKRFQFLANPWAVSLLLLAARWVSRDSLGSRPLVKIGLSLLLMAATVGIAGLWGRLRHSPPALASRAAQAAVLLGLFAAAVAIWQKDPKVSASSGAQSRPNVLLITMDTVRADHTSLYGYQRDTTPNLRAFAREATLYTRAIATSDFTVPTHASLFTGLYPNWNGALMPPTPDPRHIVEPLRSDRTTLAEILRSQGYWTAESAANFGFLAPWTGLARGFAVADFRRPVDLSTGDRPFYLRSAARRLLNLAVNTARLDRPSLSAWDINRSVLRFLDSAKAGGAPFFLFVNYMDAHTPYVPDPPFDTLYPGFDKHLAPRDIPELEQRVNGGEHRLTEPEVKHLTSQYDGGIAEEDAAIGDLLKHLRRLGLYDDTLVIITADHGDAHGEHDLMDHVLGFVYQELVHVPLTIKYPWQPSESRSDDLVSQVDILPTVLDVLDLNPGPELQGRSLLKTTPSDVAVYSQGTRTILRGAGNPRFAGLRRAIFSGSMELIAWTAGPPELYDLASDPAEQYNLYRRDDLRAIELARRLEAWVAAMPRTGAPQNLDKTNAERVRSLGYTQ